jgi:hypothetical protein
LKGLLAGRTAKFKKVGSFCESMVFMIVKGSKDEMERALGRGSNELNLIETPRCKKSAHHKGVSQSNCRLLYLITMAFRMG